MGTVQKSGRLECNIQRVAGWTSLGSRTSADPVRYEPCISKIKYIFFTL